MAVAHRDREAKHRPWIALYGGALHNDRFPADGVEQWSYAAKADAAAAAIGGAAPVSIPAAGAVGLDTTLWLLDEGAASKLPGGQ